ncbi:S66 family peptidase [Candidatus Enterococcus ferrettii]|uniref:LD-carboxypeptidase n=1 Tax=Candidatus Enterococcus ferrettii TaxID=2815324 RepID=A0ABV0ETX1_9ENTE|nr:S66 peptidase family protein [Enterococcus sp. 665A]MBO1339295.1 LD-carboxypeptidase [Enterococcus sp. 665A]
MLKSKKLSQGDTIALISLSAGLAGETQMDYRWKRAKERLESFGYHVVLTPNALQSLEYLYDHPEKRAEDLMGALQDQNIDAIICMIGGNDTIRLLPYIDFEVVRNHPKLFVGYSDSTINHFMFHHAGVCSIYGPCALIEFAENVKMHDYTLNYFLDLVSKNELPLSIESSLEWTSEFLDWFDTENQFVKREMQKEAHGHEFLQGKQTIIGQLLGGCLDTFPMMMGTEIWPQAKEWQGKVLFLETSEMQLDTEMFTILLRGLAAQGIFNQISGLLVGKPMGEIYYQEYKKALLQVINKECGLSDLPIVYNLNFGHNAPIISLPIGCQVEINCSDQKVLLIESPIV